MDTEEYAARMTASAGGANEMMHVMAKAARSMHSSVMPLPWIEQILVCRVTSDVVSHSRDARRHMIRALHCVT